VSLRVHALRGLEGRECGVETDHAESSLGEDAYVLDTGGTTSTVLGQGYKCLVAHAWEEDSIESERCEQATFLGLSGGSEGTLNRQGTAVGNVSEIGDVGCAANRAARVKDSNGCVAQAEHSFGLNDNKVRVTTIGGKGVVNEAVRRSGEPMSDGEAVVVGV
jgi:hypothetical protein